MCEAPKYKRVIDPKQIKRSFIVRHSPHAANGYNIGNIRVTSAPKELVGGRFALKLVPLDDRDINWLTERLKFI